MRTTVSGLRNYLAEWYRPEVTEKSVDDIAARLHTGAAPLCAEGTTVRLILTLAVPTDGVSYGVFAARSPDDVIQACKQAGIPADRIGADVDVLIAATGLTD